VLHCPKLMIMFRQNERYGQYVAPPDEWLRATEAADIRRCNRLGYLERERIMPPLLPDFGATFKNLVQPRREDNWRRMEERVSNPDDFSKSLEIEVLKVT